MADVGVLRVFVEPANGDISDLLLIAYLRYEWCDELVGLGVF